MARPKKEQRKPRPPSSTIYWRDAEEKARVLAILGGADFSAWARERLLLIVEDVERTVRGA